jgi:hypothetical protein
MILTAKSRHLDIKEGLCFPLGPIPWSLSATDGSLRKTNKSVLCKAMVKSTSLAEDIIKPICKIIDGMGLVQKINGILFKNIKSGHVVKQWRKFLCNSNNKTLLIRFIVDEWKLLDSRRKLGDKTLYVTYGNNCEKITILETAEMENLQCNHEEADTRVFLHAQHAANNGYASVIITAQDTDILVMAVALESSIYANLYQKMGTKNKIQYVDVRKVAINLGKNVVDALIGLHAFTGNCCI